MAKKRPRGRTARLPRQKIGGAVIVENAKLPRMGEAASPVDGKRPRAMMPDMPSADKGKVKRMGTVRGAGRREGTPPAKGFADQRPASASRGASAGASGGPGYLRLRVAVEDGVLSLAGGTVVDGPLRRPDVLQPGLAYEVTVDGKRIATGEVLDAGEFRSFPDPSGRPAMSGHHVTTLPRYEITVRVPLDQVSLSGLGRAQIALYRWRGTPAEPTGAASIRRTLGRRVETVGRLKGIRLVDMPKRVQTRVRQLTAKGRSTTRRAGTRRK